MRRPLSLLLVVLAAGACADGAAMAPPVIAGHPPLVPTAAPSTPAVDALLADAADAVARDAAARPGEIPALFVERTRALAAAFAAPSPPRLEVAPACHGVRGAPVGDGALVPVRLVDAAGTTVWERIAFLRRAAGALRLHERVPRDVLARTRVVRTAGDVWCPSTRCGPAASST